jgi:two-component system, NarL family, nitrate/nitrite response regulator NarL
VRPHHSILSVEDDPDMRMLIRATLRLDDRLQLESEADNMIDALQCVKDNPPDLIILDHFIHGETMGLQGAPLLSAAAPETKILLFTSHDLTVEVAKEPAIDHYLRKGDIQQLLPVVQQLLGLSSGPA